MVIDTVGCGNSRISGRSNKPAQHGDAETHLKGGDLSKQEYNTDQLPVLFWKTDCSLRIILAYGGALSAAGVKASDLVGKIVGGEMAQPALVLIGERAHHQVLSGCSTSYRVSFRDRWFQVHLAPVYLPDERISGCVGVLYHVTQAIHKSNALRTIQARYSLLAKGSNDGTWDWDLRSGKLFYSAAWLEMMGLIKWKVPCNSKMWRHYIHLSDFPKVKHAILKFVRGAIDVLECEFRVLREDGTFRHLLVRGAAYRDPSGRAIRAAGSLTDVTDRRIAENMIHFDSLNDFLTGLPNRGYLVNRLKACISSAEKTGVYRYAVLQIDLTGLERVNDSYGHHKGDQLLVAAAQRLKDAARAQDTVARLGGGEFTILCPGLADPQHVISYAKGILAAFQKPIQLSGLSVTLSVRVGIALGHPGHMDHWQILREANAAKNRAKDHCPDQYNLFCSEISTSSNNKTKLLSELKRALISDEFVIVYQPVVSIPGGKLVGFESLVRWRHPKKGILEPGAFIPSIDQVGLGLNLTKIVLDHVCRGLAQWNRKPFTGPHIFASINVFGNLLKSNQFAAMLSSMVRSYGLELKLLQLEIHERSERLQKVSSIKQFKSIRSKIIQIDDFGIHPPPLQILNGMPVSAVKLPSSLVTKALEGESSRRLLRSIIELAHGLGYSVIAKGVEKPEIVDLLKALKCNFAQGNFFCRPLPFEEATRLVQSRRI